MTKSERYWWRDWWPSQHHRQLGRLFPMCDVDALLYHGKQEPIALIDWKRGHGASSSWEIDPSIKAQRNLANLASLPFFVVAYWPSRLTFHVWALNASAEHHLETFTPTMEHVAEVLEDRTRTLDGRKLRIRQMDETGWLKLESHLRGLTQGQHLDSLEQLLNTPLPNPPGRNTTGDAVTYTEDARDMRARDGMRIRLSSAALTAKSRLSASGEVTPSDDAPRDL